MTRQKKQLTLDTDWHTAAFVLASTVVFIAFGAASLWAVLNRKWLDSAPTWESFLTVGALVVALIKIPDRIARIGLLLFLFRPLIRIIGWWFHFSSQAKAMNDWMGQWALVACCLVICVDGILWFKSKMTYS
jgi:uncharacterized membrane protein